jgi:biopolymer transport protein TolR
VSLRKVRYRTEPLADINMTNLIDIVMVLLIVFILVSNFVTTGLDIAVPKVKYVEATGKERIVVGLNSMGDLTVNAEAVSMEALPERFSQLFELYPEESIFIQADQSAMYGDVANVISIAKEVGFTQVNLPMQLNPKTTE